MLLIVSLAMSAATVPAWGEALGPHHIVLRASLVPLKFAAQKRTLLNESGSA